jgi:uncharacterized membrane protein (DUF2068 family)
MGYSIKKMLDKHPPALVAIIVYKIFVAILLAITAIALLLTLKNHQYLEAFSESYMLEVKHQIINWFLDKLVLINPRTLKFSGIAFSIYSILTAIEAIGLWYEKAWARFLVLGLVGLSIPLEVYELIQKITPIKLIILVINVGILGYLLFFFPKHEH